jgi:3-(3-hydroxy-phenyl)propionate hydroxylase
MTPVGQEAARMSIDAVDLPPYRGEPVLIVGNGPVGQSTALLLARWGIASILLDRRPARDLVGSKAICQHRDVLDIWESVGAGRGIADGGVTWVRARTFYQHQELFVTEFKDRGRSPFPPFVNISQSRTEELLDEQIAQCPPIDVRWNHEVTNLKQDADGVSIEVWTTSGQQVLRAPYAVVCAGPRCDQLRTSLGVTFDGMSFDDHFLICDIRADLGAWEHERRFYFDPEWNPGRQVLIHPCPDSTYRIDWQVPADFDLDEEERSGKLDARIRQIVGDADFEIVWHSVYRFHSRCASRMLAGRVLLAGDSAHLMAPFGARGLNSGVADAENAAWKLAFVLRGWADGRLLDSYDLERRAAAQENLDVTTTTMNFLVPQNEEAWQERRITLEQAASDPGARSQVDSGRLSEPFWYVDSPLTTPDPTRTPASRPPRGESLSPGVGVVLPDCPVVDPATGAETRVRRLARHGISVLVTDAADVSAVAERVASAVSAPVRVLAMPHLSHELAPILGARSGECWVVRPDAWVAAIVPADDGEAVQTAVRRCVAASL